MFPSQRRDVILHALRAERSVSVAALAERMGVSEMTVRRDLDRLARDGKLERVHGGALRVANEPPFSEVVVNHFVEKDRVGAAGAALVHDGETILIDIGTTCLQLARHLRGRRITVVTSNLAVYEELLPENEIELVLLGGIVRRNYRSLVGFLAEDALRQLSADRAFLGTSGIRDDGAVMDTTMVEVPIKRGMIAAAAEIVLLADTAKFGGAGVARICGPDELDVLVTGRDAPVAPLAALERAGVEVIRA
jgi:DeoR/GlpR family transcriptional regulator of sugar metabolism